VLFRSDTIALLEQAGGKRGDQRGPSGLTPGTAQYFSSPTSPGRQMSAMADGREYHGQGCSNFNVHKLTNALADFQKSCELGSELQDYSYFYLWIVRSRLGEKEAATRELVSYLEHRNPQSPANWPLQVGRFLAGQVAENDFLKAADNPNPQTSDEQRCEAFFYVGSKRLVEGDKMGAVEYFKKCLLTNVRDFEEFQSAEAELHFLEMPAPN
jgi:lipoprotein NlpI